MRTRSTDALPVSSTIVLIYGQPGIGKTSLAITAATPILIDADNGQGRAAFRVDAETQPTWQSVAALLSERAEMSMYNTVVIDTVGRLAELAMEYIAAKYPRMYNSETYKPSQEGYGMLKGLMGGVLRSLRDMGKDVVLIAHENDDDECREPKITGSTAALVKEIADLIGYYSLVDGRRVVDFRPSSSHWGKDSAGLGAMEIAPITASSTTMADMIAAYKAHQAKVSAASAEVMEAIERYKEAIASADSLNALKAVYDAIRKEGVSVEAQLRHLVTKRKEVLAKEAEVSNG